MTSRPVKWRSCRNLYRVPPEMELVYYMNRIFALFLVGWACSMCYGEDSAEDSAGKRRSELESMIDSLANQNKAPKIVDISCDLSIDKSPLFPKGYKFSEDRRVCGLARRLAQLDGDELWPLLVKHFDDKRYAITYAVNESVIQESVAGICGDIVWYDLEFPYRRYIDAWKLESASGTGLEDLIFYEPIKEFDTWYGSRKTKPLHELQIELCEGIIAKTLSLNNVPLKEKEQFINDVNADLKILRTTGKAIVPGKGHKLFAGAEFYDEDEARKIRENWAKKQSGRERSSEKSDSNRLDVPGG